MSDSALQGGRISPGWRSRWLLPVICLLGVGCSSSPWKREFVYSAQGVSLYHEYQEAESGRASLGYEHPVELSVEKAVLTLSQLVYKKTYLFKKAEKKYVFSPEEIRAFAPRLVLALRELSPDERLRFLITRSNWSDVFLGTSATSGVIFSEDEGILEMAFDLINDRFAAAEDGDPEKVTFRTDPTDYRGGSPLVARPGIVPHVDPQTGKSVPRWVEVRVAEVRRLSDPRDVKPPPVSVAPEDSIEVPPRPDLDDSASEPKTPADSVATPENETKEAGEEDYDRLKERIETLKRLRDDGLITEEEFQESYEKAIEESLEE